MLAFLRKKPWTLAMVGAVLTAFTLVFPVLGALEWFSMIPLFLAVFWMCEDPAFTGGRAYRYSFLMIFSYYFVLYHWFVNLYPLDFAGLDNTASIAVVAVAWIGLPLLQAIPGGLILVFYRLVHQTGLLKRVPILRPILFSALWVVFEWSSTLHWTGVPWGRLALGQASLLPMLQSASLLGSYFVSFLILLVNGLLAHALVSKERRWFPAALAVLLLFSNLLFGSVKMALPEKEGVSVKVAVIQPNLNSHDKWDGGIDSAIELHGQMTAQAVRDGAQLVIWPETAIPAVINDYSWIDEDISQIAIENGVHMIIGGFYEDEEGNEYNALFSVDPEGVFSETVYGKRHLVPFGEYVPMREVIVTLIPPLAEISMLESDLTPGVDSALFDTSFGRLGGLICFDSIYEKLALDSTRDGAELLIISSNDSWFMDSAAVYQHCAQASLRAIETGRYIARSANTGISAVITPKGENLSFIDPLTKGYAVNEVTMQDNTTLYTTVGNLFVYLCMMLSVGAFITGIVFKRKEQQL